MSMKPEVDLNTVEKLIMKMHHTPELQRLLLRGLVEYSKHLKSQLQVRLAELNEERRCVPDCAFGCWVCSVCGAPRP